MRGRTNVKQKNSTSQNFDFEKQYFSNSSLYNSWYRKKNDFVEISIVGNATRPLIISTSIGIGWLKLDSVKTGYIPDKPVYFKVYLSSYKGICGKIDIDGGLYIYKNVSTSYNIDSGIFGHVMYYIGDIPRNYINNDDSKSWYRKIGNIVEVSFNGDTTSALTLPSEYCPPHVIYGGTIERNVNTLRRLVYKVDTDGRMQIRNPTTTNSWVSSDFISEHILFTSGTETRNYFESGASGDYRSWLKIIDNTFVEININNDFISFSRKLNNTRLWNNDQWVSIDAITGLSNYQQIIKNDDCIVFIGCGQKENHDIVQIDRAGNINMINAGNYYSSSSSFFNYPGLHEFKFYFRN